MAAPPAFQFYPRDFLADRHVAVMNAEERGVYITLLCFCWLEGGLPDDPEELATLAVMDVSRFQVIWTKRVGRCFKKNDEGLLVNSRLEAERAKQEAFRAERAESGRRGGLASWDSRRLTSSAKAQLRPDAEAQLEANRTSSSASSSATAEERSGTSTPPVSGGLELAEGTGVQEIPASPAPAAGEARRVLSAALKYLNKLSGHTFEPTEARAVAVKRILGEGRRLEDIRAVIWSKCKGPRKWLGNERMDQHLNPDTLLRRANFQRYLEEAREELAKEMPERARELGYSGPNGAGS